MAETTPQAAEPHRAQWKTQWGFLSAAIGSAIGLGSIWRFPYVVYENGGGAHLREHVNAVSLFRIGRLFDFSIKYLIPAILIVLLFNDLMTDIRRPYGGYPWIALLLIGRDWLIVTFIAALIVAMRPWRKAP